MHQVHSTCTPSDSTATAQDMPSNSLSTCRGRPSKGSAPDTLAQVLRLPSAGPIPKPMTVFKRPLCLEMVRRKAVAAHLRTIHQFERPNELDLKPNRDVIPGRLPCAHCKATFSVEFALRTHFQKASCPVKLRQFALGLHFGPVSSSTPLPLRQSMQIDL